jgi:hypothetical protein
MDKTKFSLSLVLAFSLLLIQFGGAFAAPAWQGSIAAGGIVQSLTLETDAATGITTVIVDLVDENGTLPRIRVSQKTAIALGLVVLNEDGKAGINDLALGLRIEVNPKDMIPVEATSDHPVGSALATFFSDIAGIDYEMIMSAHEQGVGFGVIAQALWLTTKLSGNSDVFEALLYAKETGDYSNFTLKSDGSTPKNWGQLRDAILDTGQAVGVGGVMSNSNANENGNGNNNDRDRTNHGNGNHGDNNANGNQNNNKEKDKNK